MRRTTTLLVLALLLLAAACEEDYEPDDTDYGGDESSDTTQADDEVDLDEAAVLDLDQRDVQVDVGDTVVVTLEENQSVGDLWQVAEEPDDEVLELVSDEAIGPEDDCDGCGGSRQVVFQAVGDGGTSFVMANCYRCDTEGNSSETPPDPAEVEFSVEVTA